MPAFPSGVKDEARLLLNELAAWCWRRGEDVSPWAIAIKNRLSGHTPIYMPRIHANLSKIFHRLHRGEFVMRSLGMFEAEDEEDGVTPWYAKFDVDAIFNEEIALALRPPPLEDLDPAVCGIVQQIAAVDLNVDEQNPNDTRARLAHLLRLIAAIGEQYIRYHGSDMTRHRINGVHGWVDRMCGVLRTQTLGPYPVLVFSRWREQLVYMSERIRNRQRLEPALDPDRIADGHDVVPLENSILDDVEFFRYHLVAPHHAAAGHLAHTHAPAQHTAPSLARVSLRSASRYGIDGFPSREGGLELRSTRRRW